MHVFPYAKMSRQKLSKEYIVLGSSGHLHVLASMFSHFMCMEKTSGLPKICAGLWSPPVTFSFFLPFFLSVFHTI
jgi:hypothetical protein